ncbi:MAG: GAF and ANTAR domain-containing protein [Acidimicrobiales bacterium]
MVRDIRVATTMVELADTLVTDFDVVEFLSLLTERSAEIFQAAAAGVLLRDPAGALCPVASSNEQAELIELWEVRNDEGPCVECYRNGSEVVVTDFAEDEARWPTFSMRVRDLGFRSALAVPMRHRDEVIGALNLFRPEVGAWDTEDVSLARALADVATIGLLQARTIQESVLLTGQLHFALNSRVTIEQAKGVMAERLGITVIEAFALIRRYARSHRQRLVDVAGAVVDGSISVEDFPARPR